MAEMGLLAPGVFLRDLPGRAGYSKTGLSCVLPGLCTETPDVASCTAL